MRLLVCPHDLSIGGSQINAIDLAASVAAAGHEAIIYGVAGPLVDYVAEKGLRFIAAHPLRYRPAPTRIWQISEICRRERIDLVHAYEWPPCLDAYYGAGLLRGVPILCTLLSMSLSRQVPASVPLIVGTADLADEARCTQRGPVWCLEPPIDTDADHPEIDGATFRQRAGVVADELLVVSVSRLALDLKLDALVRAIDAADLLAPQHRLKLVLIGDGPAREALLARAAAVNRRHAREVVSLPGATLDPRSAYAGADLVLGMGSSALRGLAIGRPVVVQGEEGFSEIFEPATLGLFLRQGFYGLADGVPGAQRLAGQIESLLTQPGRRAALGALGRRTVVDRFSLSRATGIQQTIYQQVLAQAQPRRLSEALAAGWQALGVEISNHDPRRKAARRQAADTRLAAARSGTWPTASEAPGDGRNEPRTAGAAGIAPAP